MQTLHACRVQHILYRINVDYTIESRNVLCGLFHGRFMMYENLKTCSIHCLMAFYVRHASVHRSEKKIIWRIKKKAIKINAINDSAFNRWFTYIVAIIFGWSLNENLYWEFSWLYYITVK